MKKSLLFKCVISVVISSSILFFLINTIKAQGNDSKPEYITITVKRGDTLWNIVKENCENYKDIRKAIYDIKKVNNITSANIMAGQEIKIPLKLHKQSVE